MIHNRTETKPGDTVIHYKYGPCVVTADQPQNAAYLRVGYARPDKLDLQIGEFLIEGTFRHD